MNHLDPFRARQTLSLPLAEDRGWRLKRYAILSNGRELDDAVIAAATEAAFERLPTAGELNDADGNHGVGFQIVHFAEQIASVSPVFYWQWGSVLANAPQMRAAWETPTQFGDGVTEVVGCVWEMQVVSFEAEAWTLTVLSNREAPKVRLENYLNERFTAPRTGA